MLEFFTFNNDAQFKNIFLLCLIFLISHISILGKDDKEMQLENNSVISSTLPVFHLDISGKDDNDLQFENISFV